MAGSFGIFDDVVAEMVRKINPRNFLDIGAGAGKYGHILRHHVPNCHRIALEVEETYVEKFGLRSLYNEIKISDATKLINEGHDDYYDLVIIGDCIEHMPKSLGLDLLNFLTYRTQYIIVLAPEFFVQGTVDGVKSESHISVWSEYDFQWHDAWAFENALTMSMFVLRGYQESECPLNVLVNDINNASVPVMDFDRKFKVRNAHLDLHVRRRTEIFGGTEVCYRKK